MLSYLALGDSYTIGEGLDMQDNFPHQLSELLRQQGISIADPVVIATTGWTTSELWEAIKQRQLTGHFSLVTLLIGVNNQYRGQSLSDYATEFEQLLMQAIDFAAGITEHVLVLSIPDWGLTPFAKDRDPIQIAKEIDAFNQVNQEITKRLQCLYADITPFSREIAGKEDQLVSDGLHYSTAHYKLWAEKAARIVSEKIK